MCKVEPHCGIRCITVTVIAACALGGCGKVTATSSPDAAETADAPMPDAALTWSPFTQVKVNYAGQVRVPVPSGDGLTLYFSTELTSSTGSLDYDLYSASRASTADGFGVATALLNVNVSGEQARYPDVSEDGLELYYSKGDGGPIMVATRSNTSSAFAAPCRWPAGSRVTFRASRGTSSPSITSRSGRTRSMGRSCGPPARRWARRGRRRRQ